MEDSALTLQKAEQVAGILDELDLDTWLIWVRETGQIPDPAMNLVMEESLVATSALLFHRTGERTAVVAWYDADGLPEGLFDRTVTYEQGIGPQLLAELRRLDPARIGINVSQASVAADGMTAGMLQRLEGFLKETPYAGRLVSAEDLVGSLRGRKLPEEIRRIQSAVDLTDRILAETIETLHPGLSECEIHQRVHEAIRSHGATTAWDPGHCPAVDAGPGKAFGHVGPTESVTKEGHLLHFDFGVRVSGYCADLQRMVFFGAPSDVPEEVARAFDTVSGAIQAAARVLRPGIRGYEVDQVARDFLAERGYPEYMHALGHQLGRFAHDGGTTLAPQWPRYRDAARGIVEEGNVFTLELEVPTEQYGQVSLEEDVVVTGDGCRFLSAPQTELICTG